MGRIDEDMQAVGAWTFTRMPSLPAGITNAMVAAGAAIDQSKLQHQHRIVHHQPNSAATSETLPVFRCYGTTATLIEVAVGSIAIAVGAATVTVDIKKNGTTVLSAVVTLDTGNTAYVGELASISVPGMVAGDVLTAVIVATAGGGTLPTGVYIALTIKEDAN